MSSSAPSRPSRRERRGEFSPVQSRIKEGLLGFSHLLFFVRSSKRLPQASLLVFRQPPSTPPPLPLPLPLLSFPLSLSAWRPSLPSLSRPPSLLHPLPFTLRAGLPLPPYTSTSHHPFPTMPLLSALNLSSLLSALGLVTSLLKPVPIVGDLVPGLLGTLIPIVNQTLSNLPILAAVPGEENENAMAGGKYCNNIESYSKSVVGVQAFAPFDQAMSNVFRYRQQQSVNLGSW